MSQIALELQDVTSGYKASVVLRKLSMTVADGEAVALLGKNGMGKTTVLKTIMGYLPKKAGAIRARGQDITRMAPTVGSVFFLAANHEMMHAGQFSVARRKLGKPVLF